MKESYGRPLDVVKGHRGSVGWGGCLFFVSQLLLDDRPKYPLYWTGRSEHGCDS